MHSCSVGTVHLNECCIPPYLACVYMCMVTNIQHSSHNNQTFSTHMGISNGDRDLWNMLELFYWFLSGYECKLLFNHKV